MWDVFVSYNGQDRPVAAALVAALRRRGLDPFYDRERLTPGGTWMEALEQGVAASRSAVILLGPHGLGSWQQEELRLALSREKRQPGFSVIPLLLPGSEPPLGMLAQRTWIELAPGDETALDMLASAIRGEPPSVALQRASAEARDSVCPYRGLAAFREEDAAFFLGREAVVDELERRMAGRGLTALVGASGSGKSSIAQAGLSPRLRRAAPGETPALAVLQPRREPFVELAGQLLGLLLPDLPPEEAPAKRRVAARELRQGDARLADWARDILRARRAARLVLVVDQWEELYTEVTDEAERTAFIDLLLAGIAEAPVVVLATLRGDYVGHALQHEGLVGALQGGTVLVGPMDRAGLRRSIEEPARQLGVAFQDGLVERMLAEVEGQPGTLPLLQFLLEGMWRARRGGTLTHEAYESLGGARGAIATRADTVFESLSAAEQALARDVLVSLVRPGEGTLDSRRLVDVSTLPDASRAIVYRLGQARLLVADGRQVEVTHEALIREWRRLRDWVEQDRHFLRLRDRLEPEARAWEGEVAAEDLLIPAGRRLEEARDLLRQRPTMLDGEPHLRRYVEASVARADHEAAAREAARQAEEAARRAQVRRARRTAASFAALFLMSVGVGGWAVWERGRADRNAHTAEVARGEAETVAAALREANALSVAAGDRFVIGAADRLRQVAGMPASRIEELLQDGEAFFADLARRAGETPDLARSLARMQMSFARTSQDLGSLQAQVARARQAQRLLEPLADGGGAEDLLLLAEAQEMEAEALLDAEEPGAAVTAARSSLALRETAAGGPAASVQGQIALALGQRLLSWALDAARDRSGAVAAAEACRDVLLGLSDSDLEVQHARVQCLLAMTLTAAEPERRRAAALEGLALVEAAGEVASQDPRFLRLRSILQNNLGAALASSDRAGAATRYAAAVEAARVLHQLDGGNLRHRAALAMSLHDLGLVSDGTAAIVAFEEAYALRRGLVDAQPTRRRWEIDMTASLDSLLRKMRDTPIDPRLLPLERANHALRAELAGRPGAAAAEAQQRFDALYHWAEAERRAGNGEVALQLYLDVIAIAEPLLDKPDAPAIYRRNLSYAVPNLRGAANEAPETRRLALLERAEAELARFVGLDPRHRIWREVLGEARLDLARLLLARGENALALRPAQAAAEGSTLAAAAQLLADWYRSGSGPVLPDPVAAERWVAEVRLRRDGTKRFTVPAQYRGIDGRHTTYFFVRDIYPGTEPIEEEIYRLEHYDGVLLPDDVKDSFLRLQAIARNHNVSLQDLAVYALGTGIPTQRDSAVRLVELAMLRDRPADAVVALERVRRGGAEPREVLAVTAGRPNFNAIWLPEKGIVPEQRRQTPIALVFGLGKWLAANGQEGLARDAYAALLEAGNLTVLLEATVRLRLAAVLEAVGETERAEAELLRVASFQPDDAAGLVALGLIWADRGGAALDRAAVVLARAEQAAPGSGDVLAAVGWVAVQRGQVEQGIEQLERARALLPRQPRLLAYLGEAYRRGDRGPEARQAWEAALELRPDPRLRNWIEAQLRRL